MTMTRDYKQTIQKRLQDDPAFAAALADELQQEEEKRRHPEDAAPEEPTAP